MPAKISKLIVSIGICLGAGVIGSFFTVSSIPTWYAAINKPIFSPPNWVFAPVWTVLYILMGISLYFVLISKSKLQQIGIVLFLIQLGLNALWSFVFFGLRNPAVAFVEIIVLWITIFLTIKVFYKISKVAGSLLIPYILWVTFATALNGMIVLLN